MVNVETVFLIIEVYLKTSDPSGNFLQAIYLDFDGVNVVRLDLSFVGTLFFLFGWFLWRLSARYSGAVPVIRHLYSKVAPSQLGLWINLDRLVIGCYHYWLFRTVSGANILCHF